MKIFDKHSIRYQITKITTLYALILILITTFSYRIFYESFSVKKILRASEFNLQLISNVTLEKMNAIFTFSDWCANNSTILSYLSSPEGTPINFDAYERFKEEFYSSPVKNSINRAIICKQGTNQDTFLQILTSDSESASIYDANTIFDSLHLDSRQLPKQPTLLGLIRDPLSPDQKSFSFIQNITLFNGKSVGWVYISVPEKLIIDSVMDYETSINNRLFFQLNNTSYEINNDKIQEIHLNFEAKKRYHDIAYHSETVMEKVSLPTEKQSAIYVSCPVSKGDLSFFQLITDTSSDSSEYFYYFILLFSLITVVLLTIFVLISLNHSIVKPVHEIKKKISAISDGDFEFSKNIEGKSELGQIGCGINIMSRKIQELIQNKLLTEKQKLDLELQILHNQINPHFLYNTLNSIRLMAILQNATGIPEMTTALSHLLKSITKNTAYLIPLKDELNLLQDYFLIERYRYSGSINLNVKVQNDKLQDGLVPKMMLQPLIENSIFHGIEPKGIQGFIDVTIAPKNNTDFTITIFDNGIGIPADKLSTLLSTDTKDSDSVHIGLTNVHMRIKYHFGERYGLEIESQEMEYTKIIITLPYQKEVTTDEIINCR